MKYITQKEALMMLEDGTVYKGFAIGKIGTSGGELCFNTGMTGYQEIFTDPSYTGQIIVNTTPHVGNYGVIDSDQESNGVKISGLVCKHFSNIYSRQTAEGSLQDYFQKEGIVGISTVDTRSIVRYIRNKGAMNAVISSETTDLDFLKEKLKQLPSMKGLELASKISTKKIYDWGDKNASYKVAVLDLGVKKSILNNLTKRDCTSRIFPAKTSFSEMKKWDPDGYFLSNGPGDPASMGYAMNTVKQILKEEKPLFGICLGHQILALANGISTYKMHHGHRGLNHPVKNLLTGKCEITSQNHGFSVTMDDIVKNSNIDLTHINLNDNTVEGIRLRNKKVFSVQYHPESSPGPHDSGYLFDEFVEMIKKI